MRTCAREDVCEQIICAANRLFIRYGYRKTTVEDIAVEAKMSRGTIYLHFRSKEEIAMAWGDRFTGTRCERLRQIALTEQSPVERIHAMLRERVLFSFDHVQPYGQGIDEIFAALRPMIIERRKASHIVEATIVAGVIEEGNTLGELSVAEPYRTAYLLILMTNTLLPYSLSTDLLGDRALIEAHVDGMAQIALDGLRARA